MDFLPEETELLRRLLMSSLGGFILPLTGSAVMVDCVKEVVTTGRGDGGRRRVGVAGTRLEDCVSLGDGISGDIGSRVWIVPSGRFGRFLLFVWI